MDFKLNGSVKNGRTAKFLIGVFTLSFMLSMTVQPLVFGALATQPPDTGPAPDVYSILGTATVSGMVATANGIAFVDASGANEQTIHIAIDWNENQTDTVETTGVAEILADTLVHTTCTSTCSVTWGPINHDYSTAGGGTYKAFAIVYHGGLPGRDGLASSQIAEITIIIPDASGPAVSITSPADSVVTGPTGTITYTVDDSVSVACTLDTISVLCSLDGSHSFTLLSGEHVFQVTGTDSAGKTGSDSVTWTVDATGPVVTIVTGPSNGSTVTTDDGTFTFTANEISTFKCTLDGGLEVACDGSYAFTNLSEGPHTFTVTGTDTYGNVGSPASRTWTIDTTPPEDNTPPVITRLGDATVDVALNATYTDAGATALDDIDGDITSQIVTVNPVNTSIAGTYTVTYNVSDFSDNAAVEVTRTVNVIANPECSDNTDNDGDGLNNFGTGTTNDPGCSSAGDNDESTDITPPSSTFGENNRNHQFIVTEMLALTLSGQSTDNVGPAGDVKSGVANARMEIYQVANSDAVLGSGYQQSAEFESLNCSSLPGVPVTTIYPLTLDPVAPVLNTGWSYDWTLPGRGAFCAIVHATDVAGNIEHTAVAGPFVYAAPVPPTTPPTTPPPTGCQSNCGGGGGGSGHPAWPQDPVVSAPAPTAAPQVLGITTLPATSTTTATSMAISLFSAMMMTGVVMLMIGYGMVPKRMEEYLN